MSSSSHGEPTIRIECTLEPYLIAQGVPDLEDGGLSALINIEGHLSMLRCNTSDVGDTLMQLATNQEFRKWGSPREGSLTAPLPQASSDDRLERLERQMARVLEA